MGNFEIFFKYSLNLAYSLMSSCVFLKAATVIPSIKHLIVFLASIIIEVDAPGLPKI